jgi:hypothetical protein
MEQLGEFSVVRFDGLQLPSRIPLVSLELELTVRDLPR